MSGRKKDYFFEDIQVLGKLPLEERAKKFKEMGDEETAKKIMKQADSFSKGLSFFPRKEKKSESTSHQFGFIPEVEPGQQNLVPIVFAGLVQPDMSLKKKRVIIKLNALRAADYPGGGIHRILFDFYAKNQLSGKDVEEVHFNETYRIQEGQAAGVIGYPIFIGLNVGSNGLDFKCFTVNVKNDDDERILNFLDSQVFQSGLTLATTAQPAIATVADLAVGITKMVAGRNKNVAVQDIYMGLDFSKNPMQARLAKGSYIIVQIPQKDTVAWKWEDWVYDPRNGYVVNKNDNNQLIPYNYFVLGVTEYEET